MTRLYSERSVRVQRGVLYAAVLVAPLNVYRRPVGPLNVSLFRLCAAALALFLVAGLITRRREVVAALAGMRWAVAAMCAFLALDLIENSRNVTGLGDTILGQRAIFFGSVVVVATSAVVLRVPLRQLRRAFLASAVLPYALALEQWLRDTADQPLPLQSVIGTRGGLDLKRGTVGAGSTLRPGATFSDPNFLGVFCAVTFIIADQHRRRSRGWERALAIGCQLASIGVLVISASRTGIVAVLAYAAVIGLLALGRRRRRGSLAVVVPVIGVLLIGSLSAVSVLGRAASGVSSERHLETRLTAIGVGASHPLGGIGLGNLGPLLSEPPDRSSAHALPFTLFAEEGVLGVLLCGAALAIPMLSTARVGANPRELGLALSLAAALWFYDFPFALDVASLWWAVLLMRAAQPDPTLALARRGSGRRNARRARPVVGDAPLRARLATPP